MASGKNPQILALNELGQSVWYDNLSRDVLRSGELQSLISQGVSGLTSNPTIFKQAIADTSNYDDDMKQPELKGLSTEALCEELMVRDVAAAADLLRPIYDETGAGDGYASIEVSPYLAADGKGTVDAAVRLWKKLNRPNIMIKTPATPECIPAIQAVLEQGINVNVTLIFSTQVYDQVANAYISALEARVKRGEDVKNIASVASFFVSRVDASVEKALDELLALLVRRANRRADRDQREQRGEPREADEDFTEPDRRHREEVHPHGRRVQLREQPGDGEREGRREHDPEPRDRRPGLARLPHHPRRPQGSPRRQHEQDDEEDQAGDVEARFHWSRRWEIDNLASCRNSPT